MVHQRTSCYPFVHYSALALCNFSIFHCGNLYFFHVAHFSYCTFFIPHQFHVALFMLLFFHITISSCCTLFMLHFFHAALFSCCSFPCCALFMLRSSHVGLFPSCTFSMLHSVHVGLFLCCSFSMFHFFHVALFSCCTLFMLQLSLLHSFHVGIFPYSTFSMLHFFHVALFSCCTFLILKNIENKQCPENRTKKRPYTQHRKLVSLLFWYPVTHFFHYYSFEWLIKWTNLPFRWKIISLSRLETFKTRRWFISPQYKISSRYFNYDIENDWTQKKCMRIEKYSCSHYSFLNYYITILGLSKKLSLFHNGSPYHKETSPLFLHCKSVSWFH